MELAEAMRTQHACRYYRDDPVPDEVLLRAVELARFAPNGGNRCAVRFVFVRDPALRRQLGEWYLPLWEEVAAAARNGAEAIRGAGGAAKSVQTGFTDTARTMADTDQFARRFGELPVIIVVCADLAQTHPTDTGLGRLSIVGGGSVYPMAQNLCLALRAQGVATTFTTLLVAREPDVKELLGIPGHMATACHIVAGYPARPFPRRLHRPDVSELAFADRYGSRLQARARGEPGLVLGQPPAERQPGGVEVRGQLRVADLVAGPRLRPGPAASAVLHLAGHGGRRPAGLADHERDPVPLPFPRRVGERREPAGRAVLEHGDAVIGQVIPARRQERLAMLRTAIQHRGSQQHDVELPWKPQRLDRRAGHRQAGTWASMPGESSTPCTGWPSSASGFRIRPVPQPSSRIEAPSGTAACTISASPNGGSSV